MKILVCIRKGLDGEISPFDASAYEAALRIGGAEVTLISMGPPSAKDFLHGLTRLGAKRAILLCDPVFAGADTLATAYALSLAVKRLEPDLILCGRQTLVGDTAQTGPMLSVLSERSLITGAMSLMPDGNTVVCQTREQGEQVAALPALVTVERIHTLRLPSILSKLGTVEVWSADDVGADRARCGLVGSPTRVLATHENESGKRKCTFVSADCLDEIIRAALAKEKTRFAPTKASDARLADVWCVGDAPRPFAESISDDVTVVPLTSAEELVARIRAEQPRAVLFGSDAAGKQTAACVAAMLGLGLCADCTSLETDGEQLIMVRPALSGSVIARIASLTRPAMATVRTAQGAGEVVVTAGFGAKDCLDRVRAFADRLGAELATTRKAVDHDILPYRMQVGLTGKTVSPPVYLAIGVSGAVHHIVGMQQAGTVIAINPDRDAPIFDYADYGIVARAEDVLN